MEESQYIELLKKMANKYLSAEHKDSPEKIYTLQDNNSVITDLKTIKGKNYGDLKDESELARLAEDAYEWNKFLLKKKYNIDIEADVAVGKYSQEDAFVYTTIYGHKGALPYLTGKKDIEKTKTETETVIHNKTSEVEHTVRSKLKENEAINSASVEKNEPALTPIKAQSLRPVEITEKRSDIFNSGRSLDEVTTQVESKLKDVDLSDKEALKEAKKIIGKDDNETAIKITHTDTGILSGEDINKYETAAIWPLTQMEFISGYSILSKENGYKDIQLKTKTGNFSDQERFVMEYFTEKKDLPNDVRDELIKSSNLVKTPEGIYILKLELTEVAVDKYMPGLKDKQRKQLLKPFEIKMQDSFSSERYDAWRDWTVSEEANGLKAEMRFAVYDRAVNIASTKELYASIHRSEQAYDYDYINSLFGEKYPGDKSVTLQDYKKFQTEYILNTRPAEFIRKQVEIMSKSPDKYTDEQKMSANLALADLNINTATKMNVARNNIDALEQFKQHNPDIDLSKFYNLSRLLNQKDILDTEFDKNLLNASSTEKRIKLAQEYQINMALLERKLAEYSKTERSEITSNAKVVAEKLTSSERARLTDLVNYTEKVLAMDKSNYPKYAKPDPYTQVSLSGGSTEAANNKGIIGDIRIDHKSGRDIGKFGYDVDAGVNLSYATNFHPDGKNELFTPLEFNQLTKQSQKLKVAAEYNYTNHNSIELEGSIMKNNAGTQTNSSIRNNFETINKTSIYVGFNLPGGTENPLEKIDINYGLIAGVGKKFYLKGDNIRIDGGAGISSADYKNFFTGESTNNLPLASADVRIDYSSPKFSFILKGQQSWLNPFSNAENTTSYTFINLMAQKSFSGFSTYVSGNMFFSQEFSMKQAEIGASLKTNKLGHTLSVGGTRIALDMSSDNNFTQDILKLGYKLGFDSKNKFLEDTNIGLDYTIIQSDQATIPTYNTPFKLTFTKSFK